MRNLSASDFACGWSDTKKGLGTVQFWVLEVLVGGLMAIFINPIAGLIFVLDMAVAVWFGATASVDPRMDRVAAVKKSLRGFVSEAKNLCEQIEVEHEEAWHLSQVHVLVSKKPNTAKTIRIFFVFASINILLSR